MSMQFREGAATCLYHSCQTLLVHIRIRYGEDWACTCHWLKVANWMPVESFKNITLLLREENENIILQRWKKTAVFRVVYLVLCLQLQCTLEVARHVYIFPGLTVPSRIYGVSYVVDHMVKVTMPSLFQFHIQYNHVLKTNWRQVLAD